MAEKIAKFFVGLFGGIASVWWGKYLVMFIISLLPILELRGGLIAASLMGAPMWSSFLVCFIGNVLPIPFILWFITRIFDFLKSKNGKLGKLVLKLENKANSKKEQIERLKYLGLVLFVGIPLPGTGAWTGCLIAALLGMDKKKSCLAAIVGVIMAGIIMLIFSYGILGGIFRMTTIYLINNSLTMNKLKLPDSESLEQKRKSRILSIEGEKESERLASIKDLQRVNVIYSSPYVMSIGTAKYLAKELELEIDVVEDLGERVLGAIGDKKIRMVSEMQENDFYYKLAGGESLNDVKRRMLSFINRVKRTDEGKTIAMFTHNVAITSYLSEYCTKGFNLDNRLILNYHEEAIIDGAWDGINIIEVVFDKDKLVSIKKKK